jgi:tRNA threonylcarbamoyladenosine biosynthesis protein TsaE
MIYSIKTKTARETKETAAFLANEAFRRYLHHGGDQNSLVVALKGDLGVGKTTFAQGFLNALGVKQKITSPTFVLMKKYNIRRVEKNKFFVYHVDCYRINSVKELFPLDIKGIFNSPRNIILIEWAEKIKKILPKKVLWVHLKYGAKVNERIIKFSL